MTPRIDNRRPTGDPLRPARSIVLWAIAGAVIWAALAVAAINLTGR